MPVLTDGVAACAARLFELEVERLACKGALVYGRAILHHRGT